MVNSVNALQFADQAVRVWPGNARLLVRSAALAKGTGRTVAAIELYDRAVLLGSSEAAIQRQALIDEAAPFWHFRMMNDEVKKSSLRSRT